LLELAPAGLCRHRTRHIQYRCNSDRSWPLLTAPGLHHPSTFSADGRHGPPHGISSIPSTKNQKPETRNQSSSSKTPPKPSEPNTKVAGPVPSGITAHSHFSRPKTSAVRAMVAWWSARTLSAPNG
jgi:hypothetical protein